MRHVLLFSLFCAACSNPTTVPTVRRDAGNPGTFCLEECNLTADCVSGYTCQGRTCVLNNGAPACRSTLECQGRLGGWGGLNCQDDRGCSAGSACVGDTSAGYCARKPTTLSPCTQSAQEEMQMNERDGSGVVTVCGIPRAHCNFSNGACFVGCRVDGDCGGETPHCNGSSGLCECTTNSCHTNSSVCQQGTCHCARDSDCTFNADVCLEGACGCSTTSVCTLPKVHPGTNWFCE